MIKLRASLSVKWALIMGLVVIGLLIMGLIINNLFYYDFNLKKEKEDMLSFAKDLNSHYEDVDAASDLIDRYVLEHQANIQLLDETDNRQYGFGMTMNGGKGRYQRTGGKASLPENILNQVKEAGYTYYVYEHSQFPVDLMALLYAMDNGEIMMITLPFEELSNMAEDSFLFNSYVVVVLILIGMTIVFIISRRMTKPIVKLTQMTEKIANQDFSVHYEGRGHDEIAHLGHNINQMSNSLENALEHLKTANASLVMDLREKEKLANMRKSFLANISHELKTPIALVMSYIEGLDTNDSLDEEQRKSYFQVITKETQHMDRLVHDLLSLAELEYDATQLSMTALDLSSLVDEILDRYMLLIAEKALQIHLDKPDIVMVQGDPKRLKQAIGNLIVNALEHTPQNGALRVHIDDAKEVRLEIENTGSHIPQEILTNIWNVFYKSSHKKEKRIGGSGVGLSIVKAVVDKHDGQCGAENTEDGVRFWMTLKK